MSVFHIFWLLLILQSLNAQLTSPRITNVKVLNDKSVFIQWTFNNITEIGLKRYKILTSHNNWTTEYEWPAQLYHHESYKIDNPYLVKETNSNIECFNACVDDSKCNYVQRASITGRNCYLSDSIISNGTKIKSAISAFLQSYGANQAIITDLPLNRHYKFKVSVYDGLSNSWSNFSTSSVDVDLTLNLDLKFFRTNWQKAKVTLSNNVNTASRLKFNIYLNGTLNKQIIPDKSSLGIYQPEINLINEDYSNGYIFENISLCLEACKSNVNCVQYIYFNEDYIAEDGNMIAVKNSCFLKETIDIENAVSVRPEAEAWNIRSLLSEINLDDLEIYGSYKVEVECKSNLAIVSNNNQIVYNITGLNPNIGVMVLSGNNLYFEWNLPEPLNYTRYAVYYTLNNTDTRYYILTNSSNFIDNDEKILKKENLNECFETCFNDSKCLAYTYDNSLNCRLKYDTTKPENCDNNIYCGLIPAYQNSIRLNNNYFNTKYTYRLYVQTSFGANSYPSDPRIFTFSPNTQIEIVDEFIVHRMARLRCFDNFDGIETINWYKNGELYSPEIDNGEFYYNKSYIYYNNLQRSAAGLYSCEIVFTNGQHLMSSNSVIVKVKSSIPDKPIIRSILPIKFERRNGILLQWNVDYDDVPIECVNLTANYEHEISKEICNENIRSGFLVLNKTFNCDTQFSIAVKNSEGYSTFSDYKKFDNTTCHAPGKVEYYVNEYFTAFFSLIVLLISLTLFLLTFTTMSYLKKLKLKRAFKSGNEIELFKDTKKILSKNNN